MMNLIKRRNKKVLCDPKLRELHACLPTVSDAERQACIQRRNIRALHDFYAMRKYVLQTTNWSK